MNKDTIKRRRYYLDRSVSSLLDAIDSKNRKQHSKVKEFIFTTIICTIGVIFATQIMYFYLQLVYLYE